MKLKDALLSLAAGYIVTTLPIWEVQDNLWLVGFMVTVICWDLIIRFEEFWQKRKRAQEVAASRRAHTIKYINLIIRE